jgi:hypothetical protein
MGRLPFAEDVNAGGRSGKFALLDTGLHFSESLGDDRGAHPYTPRYPRQRIPYSRSRLSPKITSPPRLLEPSHDAAFLERLIKVGDAWLSSIKTAPKC